MKSSMAFAILTAGLAFKAILLDECSSGRTTSTRRNSRLRLAAVNLMTVLSDTHEPGTEAFLLSGYTARVGCRTARLFLPVGASKPGRLHTKYCSCLSALPAVYHWAIAITSSSPLHPLSHLPSPFTTSL
ncbi:hypothetical protein P389DRAFT_46637 [Cystobasidium minutum MCA 4210]|uniref:uncharacterized protein n=1 Tax=Cystobasidium minutum MCA 4210 TaxID=1397322 RepID=UPI0034CF567A|eukprot:jgi/Rhomi1/46637/CE46636_1240